MSMDSNGIKSQRGVVLVVCLVLLAVVTLLGLTTMRSSGLGMKMVSGMSDRSLAFETAEQTLRAAEIWLDETSLTGIASYHDSCAGSNCFNDSCDNGLCVFYNPGDPFTSAQEGYECNDKLQPVANSPWRWSGSDADPEPNLWLYNDKHKTVAATHPDVSVDPKYIIEFLCYGDKPSSGQVCDGATGPADVYDRCAPQFRITALATGLNNNTKVMLQSFYKKLN